MILLSFPVVNVSGCVVLFPAFQCDDMKSAWLVLLVQTVRQSRRRDDGFTLIELLVVVIIMAILSAIALPSLLAQTNRARESEAKTYVNAINRAQQIYYLQHHAFGQLNDLELGVSHSKNYVYLSVPTGAGVSSVAQTSATPVSTARGYAGKVWIQLDRESNTTSRAIVCAGPPGTVPEISGTDCPDV